MERSPPCKYCRAGPAARHLAQVCLPCSALGVVLNRAVTGIGESVGDRVCNVLVLLESAVLSGHCVLEPYVGELLRKWLGREVFVIVHKLWLVTVRFPFATDRCRIFLVRAGR